MTEQAPQTVETDPNNRYRIQPPEDIAGTYRLKMQAGTEKQIIFGIRNDTGFPGRAQITREVQSAVMANWFPDNAIQEYPVNNAETLEYKMLIRIPEDAPPGDYAIQLEVVDLALPDETLTRSNPLILQVDPAGDFAIPAWLIAVAIGLVVAIVGIGIGAYLLSIRAPLGNIWIAYTNEAPSRLHVRLPAEAGTLDDTLSAGIPLTDAAMYAQFLNEQAEITQYNEYDPAWSPDGCQLVYGASIEVGRYFMNRNETLYALRALLDIPAAEMEALALRVRGYEPLLNFLAANPAYAEIASNPLQNPYLSLTSEHTALVSYYQQTLERVDPLFADQFYRHVASVFYEEIDRGTLYGLFTMSFVATGEGDAARIIPQIQRVSGARLDSDAQYIPANPAWAAVEERQLIAFEYVQEPQRDLSAAFLAVDIDSTQYLLQEQSLRSTDGFYYDREPSWWVDGAEQGLFFTSRRDLNYDRLRQAQLYRITLDLAALTGSTSARISEQIVIQEIQYGDFSTSTPTPTTLPGTDEPTAIPTQTPFPTLFPQVLQYTPVFTLTPFSSIQEVITATATEAASGDMATPTTAIIPTQVQRLNLAPVQPVNISNNSVNDSQPVAIDRDSVVFVSDRGGSQPYASQQLYRLDFGPNDDRIPYRLTRDEASVLEYSASLSPDGENIAYVRQTGRAPQLYSVDVLHERDVDQAPFRITTSSADFNIDPAWQPAICETAHLYIEGRRAAIAATQEGASS